MEKGLGFIFIFDKRAWANIMHKNKYKIILMVQLLPKKFIKYMNISFTLVTNFTC